jgi:hypothetical protein
MVHEGDFVAIFQSMHRVLKAEKILKQEAAAFLLIPTPRELSSACGLAIRFEAGNRERIETILQREDVVPKELFIKKSEGYHPVADG